MDYSKLDDYTQGLLDRVVSLSKTVQNLGEGYQIVRERIDTIANLADKTTADAVRESICAEELARLSFLASQLAETGAVLLGDQHLVDLTHSATQAAEEAYIGAKNSTTVNADRQTSGGNTHKK